jgi:hypothetical protein
MEFRAAIFGLTLLSAGLPIQSAHPVDTEELTDADEDQIAETLLVYSQNHPETYLGTKGITVGYLTVRGHDPSPILMEKLQEDGFAFRPGSKFKTGDGYVISIGPFKIIAPDTANGGLFAYCGEMCAASEMYVVRKVRRNWTIVSYQGYSVN